MNDPCPSRYDGLDCHLPARHSGLHQGLVGLPDGSLGEVDWVDGCDAGWLVPGEDDDDPVFAVMTINAVDLHLGTRWQEN